MNAVLYVILLILVPAAIGCFITLAVQGNHIARWRERRRRRAAWDAGVQAVLESIGKPATVGDDQYWVTITGHQRGRVTGHVWDRVPDVREQVRSSVWDQVRRPEDG